MRAINTQIGPNDQSVCPVSVAHLQGDSAFFMWTYPEG